MTTLVLLFLMAAIPCLAKDTCRGSPDLDTKETIEPNASGSVVIDGVEFPNGSWYLSEENTTRLCFCDIFMCFRKCCGDPWQSFDLTTIGCTNITDPTLPPFQPDVYNKSNLDQRVPFGNVNTIGTRKVSTEAFIYNSADYEFFLLNDGTLLLRERCGETPLRPETFCIDRVEDTEETVVIAQKEDLPESCSQSLVQGTIYPLAMMASLPFLAATFLAYAIVPKLRNLHGRCLMCHVSSLFVGYLVFGVQNICRSNCDAICVPSALVAYMGFLSAFFWLNVMCYDIWSIFRVLKPRLLSPKQENWRFCVFVAYSWGVPLMIVILTSLLQAYSKELPRSIIRPNIGVRRCWFFGKRQKAVYILLPLTGIIVSNIYFMGYVIYRIRMLQKDSDVLRKEGDKNYHESHRFRLMQYLKLFITMGLSWIIEVFEILARNPSFLWDIGNFINLLQGLLIFIIFVSDRRTRSIIKDYMQSRRRRESQTSSTVLSLTSSNQNL